MNQKRNIVTLLETDPAISLCPIVGIWVFVDPLSQPSTRKNILESYLENPFVWGACLRYQFSEKIKDRAYISPETFLMVSHLFPVTTVFNLLII